jgi:hypothetical protein
MSKFQVNLKKIKKIQKNLNTDFNSIDEWYLRLQMAPKKNNLKNKINKNKLKRIKKNLFSNGEITNAYQTPTKIGENQIIFTPVFQTPMY